MKNILHGIKAFELDKKPNVFGLKSAVIWGHSSKSNSMYPLLYLRKPKGISQEEYTQLLDAIQIKFIIPLEPTKL